MVVDGVQVNIGRPRERRALAALLLDANRAVSTDRLVNVLWEQAPLTASAQIRNVMATLRQNLRAGTGQAPPISRVSGGFMIEIGEGELDLHVFEAHVQHAQDLIDAGQLAEAAVALCEAMALWRGPALGGIGESVLDVHVCRLEEQRLACVEQRIELELALGRQRTVVGELLALIKEYPLRERLVELGMMALYLCGRRQEALETFATARSYLNEHAGLDPRPQLTQLQQAVLRGDPIPQQAWEERVAPPTEPVTVPARRMPSAAEFHPELFRPALRPLDTGRVAGSAGSGVPRWEAERLRAENEVLRAQLNRIRAQSGVNGYSGNNNNGARQARYG
jgi:DNA-binding SARP family transcriptional activator